MKIKILPSDSPSLWSLTLIFPDFFHEEMLGKPPWFRTATGKGGKGSYSYHACSLLTTAENGEVRIRSWKEPQVVLHAQVFVAK